VHLNKKSRFVRDFLLERGLGEGFPSPKIFRKHMLPEYLGMTQNMPIMPMCISLRNVSYPLCAANMGTQKTETPGLLSITTNNLVFLSLCLYKEIIIL
jgi:hypothetical protein